MRHDVRIPLDELELIGGERAVAWRLRVISFQVPAAGPEIELQFDGWDTEEQLVAVLRDHGLSVLASRERG